MTDVDPTESPVVGEARRPRGASKIATLLITWIDRDLVSYDHTPTSTTPHGSPTLAEGLMLGGAEEAVEIRVSFASALTE